MTREELKQHQRERGEKCLRAIVDSTEKKKLIVAGAGTGKTYTLFVEWLPKHLVEDRGQLRAKDLKLTASQPQLRMRSAVSAEFVEELPINFEGSSR